MGWKWLKDYVTTEDYRQKLTGKVQIRLLQNCEAKPFFFSFINKELASLNKLGEPCEHIPVAFDIMVHYNMDLSAQALGRLFAAL